MSFSWFRVEADLVDHPKVFALEARLKDPNAVAYVLRLFAWAHRFAKDGRISNSLRDQVEAKLRWSGERGSLLQALVAVGLLDASRRTLDIHDWPEYQGALVKKSSHDAEVKRDKRAAEKAAREKSARAEIAVGARTLPTPQDETDETRRKASTNEPPNGSTAVVPNATPIRGDSNWGPLAEKLVVWLRAQRSLAGNFKPDRQADIDAVATWALDWMLKYEPDERARDQMCSAFNAYLTDDWAIERDCTLSLWCSENVGLHRWNAERERDRPTPRLRTMEASP